jgi:hypothetical protein
MRPNSRHFSEFFIPAVIVLLMRIAALAQKNKIALINDFAAAKHKYHNFNGNFPVAEKGKIIFKKSFG